MTKEEYQDAIEKIEKTASIERKKLQCQYAKDNNPYKLGDIIQDLCNRIIIEGRQVTIACQSNLPECVFDGPLVKKDGKQFKNGKTGLIYQSNILEVI